jgi:hypothetical protein
VSSCPPDSIEPLNSESRVYNTVRKGEQPQRRYRTGQSPKSLSGEKAGAEGWVDAGSESFSSEGTARLIGFEDIVAGVADVAKFNGEASFLVRQRSSSKVTHRPMQIVFDAPMRAHGEDGFRVGFQGSDVEAGLEAFAAGLPVDAPGTDGGERAQALPAGVASGEPACLGDAA